MIKRIIKILIFAGTYALLMAVMNFCIVVPNTASKLAWSEYSQKTNIDTLFIGSSVGKVADVDIIDQILKTNSVNMSTNDQLYKTHYDAIRFITEQHPIKRVVILTELDSLKNDEHYIADQSFLSAMYMSAPLKTRLKNAFGDKLLRYTEKGFCGSTDSINIWFEWVKCPLKTVDSIKKNIVERKNEMFSDEYMYQLDYLNKPYARKDEILSDRSFDQLNRDMINLSNRKIEKISIDKNAIEIFDCILRYLQENNIETYIIIPPRRLDDREVFGDDYDKVDDFIRYFVKKRGAVYINLDNDKKTRLKLEKLSSPFKDAEHLSKEGIEVVAPIIAQKIKNNNTTELKEK